MRFIKPLLCLLLVATLAACSSVPRQAVDAAADDAYRKALAEMKADRHEAAVAGFTQMTRDYPDLAGPYANLGLLYQQQGAMEEAAAAFDQALALQPRSAQIYNSAGVFYRAVGRFKDAEAAYLDAIIKSPAYSEAVLNLAILYDLYLNRADMAIQYYRRYLELTGEEGEKVKLWLADLERRAAAVASE